MKTTIPNAISNKQAKKLDESFDLVAHKQDIVAMWTTPESDYGFGYDSAKLVKCNGYTTEVYALILDHELSEVLYAIYGTKQSSVRLEETHSNGYA